MKVLNKNAQNGQRYWKGAFQNGEHFQWILVRKKKQSRLQIKVDVGWLRLLLDDGEETSNKNTFNLKWPQ